MGRSEGPLLRPCCLVGDVVCAFLKWVSILSRRQKIEFKARRTSCAVKVLEEDECCKWNANAAGRCYIRDEVSTCLESVRSCRA